MTPTYINKHGRLPHRGLRPWLLLPKVLAVALLFGGLMAVMLLLTRLLLHKSTSPEMVDQTLRTIEFFYRWMILPGVIASGLFGLLLWWQMPWVFLRLRWFQLKMAMVLIVLPAIHMGSLRLAQQGKVQALSIMVGLAVLLTVLVICIGRIKPNLRQNWAKDYPKQ